MTSSQGQNIQPNGQEKELYFIIINEEKLDFTKCLSEIIPQRIYTNAIKKVGGSTIEENVFKLTIKNKETGTEKKKNKSKKYVIPFIVGDDAYDIMFSIKDNSFTFETELKKGNKYIDILVKEDIKQDIIPFYTKLDIFEEALLKSGENSKIDKLYKETIDLYENKKLFNLLISLFLKTYEKKKDLCSKLIETFRIINEKENTDRDKDLATKLGEIKQIYSEADTLIKDNKYNAINFYGVLFCYLSYYDKENFSETLKKFSVGNADILYEILIIYYLHFKEPLKQDVDFYKKFMKYAIKEKKEYKILERILKYIEDIETFLYVVSDNTDDIIKNYGVDIKTKPITLTGDLKLIKRVYEIAQNQVDKKEIDIIIKIIEDIIKSSEDNGILIIFLQSSFWKKLLKEYSISNLENINNCLNLRNLFIKYNDLINKLYKDSKDEKQLNIKEDIDIYKKRDEFAFNLNDNIKKLFDNEKDKLKDEQKLAIIEMYNPYYNIKSKDDEIKFQNLRETDIFNNINFKVPTDRFKEAFHVLNFEKMFKKNEAEFIIALTSKIVDIYTFGTINEIIDTSRLQKEKIEEYYKILKDKYSIIIKPKIKAGLNDEEDIKKYVAILVCFISKIYLHDEKTSFLKDEIEDLDEKIKSLIYIDLLKKYKEIAEKEIEKNE